MRRRPGLRAGVGRGEWTKTYRACATSTSAPRDDSNLWWVRACIIIYSFYSLSPSSFSVCLWVATTYSCLRSGKSAWVSSFSSRVCRSLCRPRYHAAARHSRRPSAEDSDGGRGADRARRGHRVSGPSGPSGRRSANRAQRLQATRLWARRWLPLGAAPSLVLGRRK